MIDARTAPYGTLLLRVTIGGLFIMHLVWKFTILGLDTWWTNLEKAGYPDWVLVYTLSAEFAGAVLITLGIYARWVALYVFPMMVGATLFWFERKGFYFTAAGYELPLVWSILLLVQALVGDGPYALLPSPQWSWSRQIAPAALPHTD
jgi:putative oxidoreductase